MLIENLKSTNFLCKTKADYNVKDVDLNKKEIKRLKLHDPGYFIGRSYFGDDEWQNCFVFQLLCTCSAVYYGNKT